MNIRTLSMETDRPQIDKILRHKVTHPVQIESHGKVVGLITPQEGFDSERAERAEATIQFLDKIRKEANLSQTDVDRLLSEEN